MTAHPLENNDGKCSGKANIKDGKNLIMSR